MTKREEETQQIRQTIDTYKHPEENYDTRTYRKDTQRRKDKTRDDEGVEKADKRSQLKDKQKINPKAFFS